MRTSISVYRTGVHSSAAGQQTADKAVDRSYPETSGTIAPSTKIPRLMANNLECQLPLLLHTLELLEVRSSISHNTKAHRYHLIVSFFFLNNATSYMTILIIVQRDATQSCLFIILQFDSTCFGCQPHPSSRVHKTVTTASGICTQLPPSHVAIGHVEGR